MDLKSFLLLLVGGGGAGFISYMILDRWPWYSQLQDPQLKRIIAFIPNALLAVGAWFVLIGLGLTDPVVGNVSAWITAIANIVLGVGAVAFATSQAIHTREMKQKQF